ncbi:MAG: hypothetical protein AAFN59_08795 [Pseudomonadota bacterium]
MRSVTSIATMLVLIMSGTQASAQAMPVLECRAVPSLCPDSVAAYLAGPASRSPNFSSDLGILAARLSQIQAIGDDARALAEALLLIAIAMRPFDDDLAGRIDFVAGAINGAGNGTGSQEDDPSIPQTAPTFGPPIFASPS